MRQVTAHPPASPAPSPASGGDPRTVLLDRAEALIDAAETIEADARGRNKRARTRRELAAQYRELAVAFLRSAVGPLGITDAHIDQLARRVARGAR